MSLRRKACLRACCIILIVAWILPGCAFKDIDRRFFVVTVGVDKPTDGSKKYNVSLKLAIPSTIERFGANEALIVKQQADSITEAVRLMKSKVDKELDFGQTKSVVLGEQLVHEDINEVIDWFIRRRDIQKIAWIGIGVPNAETILKLKPKTERLPSNMLFLFFGRSGTETAYVTSEYLFDFRRRLKERGLDPILPIMEAREQDQLTINKTAVFDKNKLKLILNPDETKILNGFYVGTAKVDIAVRQDSKSFYVSVDNVDCSFHFQGIETDKPKLVVDINMIGVMEEAHMPIKGADLKLYEQLAGQVVQDNTLAMLRKLQKAGVDPIGFGLRYRARGGGTDEVWEKWKTLYKTIDIEVNSRVRLRGTGTIE